jgi:hypothetical protein
VHFSEWGPVVNAHQKIEAEKTTAGTRIARTFLQWARPGGPWLLIAIEPDAAITGQTVIDEDGIHKFIEKHNGTRNIYFGVNATRTTIHKKPTKEDMADSILLWSDNDPRDDETPDQAKERIQAKLAKYPRRGVTIDSGNGLQTFFRLEKKVLFDNPAAIADFEARVTELTLTLGCEKDKGTHNIDRIMRVPGTWNYPNKKKLSVGRTKCRARLLSDLDAPSYPLSAFPKGGEADAEPLESADFDTADDGEEFASGYDQDDGDGDTGQDSDDELARTIKDGGGNRHGPTRSEAVFYVACELVRRGKSDDKIADILCDSKNGISESIRERKDARREALRQIAKARKKVGTSKRRAHDPGDPLKIAQALVAAEYVKGNKLTLRRHRGVFWQWTGTHYKLVEDEYQKSVIWKFLQHSRPNVTLVNNVFAALVAFCQLSNDLEPPFWISDKDAPNASEFFACDNGLLHLPTRRQL